MALRASLKRMLKRLLRKLYKKKLKLKNCSTTGTSGTTGPAFEIHADIVDQPFRLLSLPIELLLQILDILLLTAPVKSRCHPLVSLRL